MYENQPAESWNCTRNSPFSFQTDPWTTSFVKVAWQKHGIFGTRNFQPDGCVFLVAKPKGAKMRKTLPQNLWFVSGDSPYFFTPIWVFFIGNPTTSSTSKCLRIFQGLKKSSTYPRMDLNDQFFLSADVKGCCLVSGSKEAAKNLGLGRWVYSHPMNLQRSDPLNGLDPEKTWYI